MIIDSHCHAAAGIGRTDPDGSSPFSRYLDRARVAGIDRTVIFSGFYHDYRSSNRMIGELVRTDPARFDGYAFVDSRKNRGEVSKLVGEALQLFACKGLKVHRRDAPITREICDVARLYGLPVLYDVMGGIGICHRLASEYPDVNFIIPHLGSFTDELKAQTGIIGILGRYQNIHTDSSGVRHFDLLERAVGDAGPGKVLFGTDGPWLHPGNELDRIGRLRLTSTEERMILGENYLRLTSQIKLFKGNRVDLSYPVDPEFGWPAGVAGFDR